MSLSFESIFCLPEPVIQQILQQGQQPNRNEFYTNRLVATVILVSSNLVNPLDSQCAKDPSFNSLYLTPDAQLMEVSQLRGYFTRFDHIRTILNCGATKLVPEPIIPFNVSPPRSPERPQSPYVPLSPVRPQSPPICDVAGIERAINKYGAEIYNKFIHELQREFGKESFNEDYLRSLAHQVDLNRDVNYKLGTVLDKLPEHQRRFELFFQNNDFWKYTQCLVNVLNSDERTER